jgi:hypothetical protein
VNNCAHADASLPPVLLLCCVLCCVLWCVLLLLLLLLLLLRGRR